MCPSELGSVSVYAKKREPPPNFIIWIKLLIAVGMLTGWYFFVTRKMGLSEEELYAAIGGTLAYLFIAYFVHPDPDTDNMGIGGYFNPEADINRFLLYLMIVLWPGKFIAGSIVGLRDLGKHDALMTRKRKPKPGVKAPTKSASQRLR